MHANVYYSTVRAVNNFGHISDEYCSDGVRVAPNFPTAPKDILLTTLSPVDGVFPLRPRYTNDGSFMRVETEEWINVDGPPNDRDTPNILALNYSWGYDSIVHFKDHELLPTLDNGKSLFGSVSNVSLLHGITYYATIMAENCCGLKTRTNSEPVTIDMTPPVLGNIDLKFFEDKKTLEMRFMDYYDLESTIVDYSYM